MPENQAVSNRMTVQNCLQEKLPENKINSADTKCKLNVSNFKQTIS